MSGTITENAQELSKNALSVVLQVTVVVEAAAKLLLDAGVHVVLLIPELSVAVTLYGTLTVKLPAVADAVMSAGHTMVGLMVS